MTVTAWVPSGRLLLIVIVMMLLLMQIDAKNNTEYRAACRNDTADQRNDSHRASPLPLSRGTTEVPPVSESRPPFLQDPFRIRIAWCQYTKVRQVLQVIALRLNKKPSI